MEATRFRAMFSACLLLTTSSGFLNSCKSVTHRAGSSNQDGEFRSDIGTPNVITDSATDPLAEGASETSANPEIYAATPGTDDEATVANVPEDREPGGAPAVASNEGSDTEGAMALPPVPPELAEYQDGPKNVMALAAGPVQGDDNVKGRWSPVYNWNIIPIHAALLPDTRVIAFGTTPKAEGNLQSAQTDYAMWNPANRQITVMNNKSDNSDIFCAGVELLPDGTVMFVGGDTRNPWNGSINAVNFFYPNQTRIQRSPRNLTVPRWYPTAITLADSRTFVHGGRSAKGQPTHVPEIYDNGVWRALPGAANEQITSNVEGKWFYPRDWVDPRGNVFGVSGSVMYTITTGGNGGHIIHQRLPNKSRSHLSSAVMYRPGEILQIGGVANGDISPTNAVGSNQAISIDIRGANPVVRNEANMSFGRIWPEATVLPNGEVFISNGSMKENQDVGSALMTEMWNPDTRKFRQLRPQVHYRLYHSISLLLADGTVMVGGGGAPGPRNGSDYQIYSPPYLFNANGGEAVRPTFGDFQRIQNWGNTITVTSSGNIKSASLVRLGTVTHSFDNGQRFIPIVTTNAGGNKVSFKLPANRNIAPPGYYMLFLLNNAGVPSISKVLSLGGGPVPTPSQEPFVPQANAIYTVTSKVGNKCLDIAGASKANGAKVRIWNCNGTNAQKYRAVAAGGGRWKLQALHSSKCVDINTPKVNGSLSHQWECIGNVKSQSLKFVAALDGFLIQNAQNNQCLEVPSGDVNKGMTQLSEWPCNANLARMQWTFKKL